jgi:tRNA dimethylallyltransferase
MASSSRPAPAPSRIVLALFGPTASGKTAVARIVCDRLAGTIVSADSAALYAGLPILTAAPGDDARLVGIVPLTDEMSVGEYQRLAHMEIDAARARGRVPIVVGGTGLYLRAALSTLELPPAVAPERRAHWQDEYDRLGAESAHAALAVRDPAAAGRVHPNDRRRVIRALELAEAGASLAPAHDRLWTDDTRHETVIVALDVPLDELDRRIEERARRMATDGAAEEARRAWESPLSSTARKVLGLELFATLPEAEAIAAVVQATRRLARYQRKWLRRMPGVVTLDGARPAEEVADEVVAVASAGERLPRH